MKIISQIKGGIGNQLFCYAAARRLAIVNGAELVLDDISGFSRDFKYKRKFELDRFNISARKATPNERFEPFPRLRRKLKIGLNNFRPFEKRDYLVQKQIDFDSRLLNYKPNSDIYIQGYWQSEDYFKDVEKIVREDLRIIPPIDKMNLKLSEKICKNHSIAVHYRFFDDINSDKKNNISHEYYKTAIKKMDREVPNAHFYFFSDKPEQVSSLISIPHNRFTLVDHNQNKGMAYADLYLMTLCDHYIIANSTFSWWGAWLGRKKDKKIIAPGFEKKYGKTWWGFKGLIPNYWYKII